jgi:predicted acetyltransferase
VTIELRIITPDELETFHQTMGVVLGFESTPADVERFRKVCELERFRAAFDGKQMVATFGTFSLHLTVPGNVLPTGGTTVVTVLPTHRRRGIMRRLMVQHLTDVHERGEPLAALWASEGSIYGRFGYGPACDRVSTMLSKPFAQMQEPVEIHGTMQLLDKHKALSIFPKIFETAAAGRPGMYRRDEAWWKYRILEDPPEWRSGASRQHNVVHISDGQPLGYVMYRTHFDPGSQTTEVRIPELIATTSGAEKALWQYVFGIDLISSIRAWNRPVDDPLLWWLTDPRRMERKVKDALWIRPVDVPAALNGRRYSSAGSIVFRVVDDICTWNTGIYQLETDSDGTGRCTKSTDKPELDVTAHALGATYLGGHRFQDLSRAGVVSGSVEAFQKADAMFSWYPLPWCQEVF